MNTLSSQSRLLLAALLLFALWLSPSPSSAQTQVNGCTFSPPGSSAQCDTRDHAYAYVVQYGTPDAAGVEWLNNSYCGGPTHAGTNYIGTRAAKPETPDVPNEYITEWYCRENTGTTPEWSGVFASWESECASPLTWDESSHSCESPSKLPEENSGGPVCPDCGVGHPINAANGSKYELTTEYRGTGSFPLEFATAYNGTGGSNSQMFRHGVAPDSVMGVNRIHNYAISVAIYPNGSAGVSRPDGKLEYFTASGSAWIAKANNPATLIRTVDGQGTVTGWEHHCPNGAVEYFGADGRLVRIVNRAGLAQTLTYSATTGLLSSVTDPNGRSLIFTYDANYLLTRVDLPDGQHLELTYDSISLIRANLTSVKYPDGSTISYLYNESGYVTLTLPLAVYDPHSLTGVIDEKGNRYDSTKFLDGGYGKIANINYLGSGLAQYALAYSAGTATITSPLGETDTRSYQSVLGRSLLTSRTRSGSGTSKTATYTYDAQGRPDVFTDFAGTTTDSDYDSATGLLTQQIDSVNNAATRRTTQIDWNTTLRVPTESRLYDSSINQPGVLKRRVTRAYNARGQATALCQIDPGNATAMAYVCGSQTDAPTGVRQTTMTYCDSVGGSCPLVGLLTGVNGPRTGGIGDITTYAYYPGDVTGTCAHRKGDLQTITNALAQSVTYSCYDGAGRPLQVSDTNGVLTTFAYSARAWLTQVTVQGVVDPNVIGADDAITTIAYEPTGAVSKITQPDGDFLSYTYDVAHRLTDITDNLSRSLHYTLDAAGNRTKEDSKNSSGTVKHTMSRVYDQLGRVQQLLNAASQATLITYDANDELDLVSDPLNHTTDQDVDALGRLIKTRQDIAVSNVPTLFQYNTLDEVTQVTDPKGLNTSYTYNGFGELITHASPDTGSSTYTYDAAGNRLTQVDARNITTTYAYDALNRLTSVSYPTMALNVAYTYDTANAACATGETYAKGHLTQFTDSTGSTQFCFDRFGNLTRKVQVNGALTQTTRFEYTLGGSLYRVTYPSGAQALYTRNTSDQVTGVQLTIAGVTSTLISSVSYTPFGPLNSIGFGNGRVQTRGYDLDYNPGLAYDTATDGFGVGFSLDAIGNVTSAGETFKGVSTTRNYSYDGLNRLTLATTPGATTLDERFTYDGTGDRQSKQIGAAGTVLPYVYPSNSHRLSSMFGQPRSYDAAGNTTSIGTPGSGFDFVYDDRGRITDVKLANVVQRSYKYNGRGERVSKTYAGAPASNLVFDYDEAGHLLGEYTTAGVSVAEYVWLDGTLVGIIKAHDGTTFQYVETDYLGTPRVVIKPTTNTAVWHWDLTSRAFGDTAPSGDPDANGVSYTLNLRFPGQYYDDVGGLNYNYFRDYEPGTGRYAESDPIGLGGGISTFGYVSGNPLKYSDSKGKCIEDLCIGEILFFLAVYSEEVTLGTVVAAEVASGVPNPVSGTTSFAGRAAQELTHDVYFGVVAGKPAYVGISSNLAGRAQQWKGVYDLESLTVCKVTKDQARGIEQALIESNPQFKNKINSISPDRSWYPEALDFGKKWLRDNGHSQ